VSNRSQYLTNFSGIDFETHAVDFLQVVLWPALERFQIKYYKFKKKLEIFQILPMLNFQRLVGK